MERYFTLMYFLLVIALGLPAKTSATTFDVKNALNVSDNVTQQSYSNKTNEMIHATIPFVLRSAGFIECQGGISKSGGSFFSEILGSNVGYNRSNYLCGPTCQGTCIPRPSDVGIPNDNLPYGCLCSPQGCDLNGPVVAPMSRPYFKMVCKPDTVCTCFGMGAGQFTGFSCHWVNTLSGLPITFTEKSVLVPGRHGRPPVVLPANGVVRYLPIQWCTCCPRL